ncbi:putative leucine-rich repeat-containing protein DDB_G0290503 [Cydia pomonella]|uniref:putative leucine-rich repeat-containing protein DDB_G0290503 n=1 Tax=Cydia pomonella TaxID=82600 RepID=UPI002ADDFB90|nr:putative leucine-rich repeat-containing protein DDB_G0290503 [Cydia pomonella]
MRFIAVGAFLVVVCALGQAATIESQTLAPPEGPDIFANTKKLIEDLAANLCKSAQQAADAMKGFASGLKDQVKIMKEKLQAEIQKLKDRVSQAISNVADRISNAGGAIKECVESHKKQADQLLNDAVYRTMTCADEKVQEISDLIARQVEISQGGLDFANRATEGMKNCTDNDNNMFIKGACLAMLALKTEMKGAVFMTQSGINVARVDIAIAKLPVALELCAGQRLLEAGMGTAKVIMDLQKCKVTNTFSALTESTPNVPDAPNGNVDISFGNDPVNTIDTPIEIDNKINNAEAKEIVPLKSYLAQLSQNQINAIYTIQSKELANIDVNRLLSISDLWDKIKNSITNAWNAVKDIANKTREKIIVWLQNIKKRAEEAVKDFEAKLEVLKDKFNKFIQALKKKAGDVKQCIQDDQDVIQDLLKQIAQRVRSCIADSVNNASVLNSNQSKLMLDDTEFIREAEDKVNKCVQEVDDADECLNKARGEIYDDMEQKEADIMNTRSISRDVIEDALETIVNCAADGIIEASEAIIDEVINIINCVKSEKEKPFV